MSKRYALKNEDRILEFDGELIASSTSKRANSLRWLEINIYATESGGFVYETIGRSTVWRPSNEANPNATLVTPDFIVENADSLQCDPKHPDLALSDMAGKYIVVETDRHRATFSPTAEGLVESAKVSDPDGILFISNTAKNALREAADRHKTIHAAYVVERV